MIWQARRDSNPQPTVLETATLPIELLAYTNYLVSRWVVCVRQNRQYFFISILLGSFFLFFIVV
jgi:hypothetical protein